MPSVQVQLSEIQDKIHNTTSNKVSKTIIQISEIKFCLSKINSSYLQTILNQECSIDLQFKELLNAKIPY